MLNRTEITIRENAAVRVGDAQIARPAIRDARESHGVESQFGEVPRVRRQRKLEPKILNARFGNARFKAQHARLPLRFRIEPQRAIYFDRLAIDFENVTNNRSARRAEELALFAGVTRVKLICQRVFRRVCLQNLNSLAHAQIPGGGDANRSLTPLGIGGDLRQQLRAQVALEPDETT